MLRHGQKRVLLYRIADCFASVGVFPDKRYVYTEARKVIECYALLSVPVVVNNINASALEPKPFAVGILHLRRILFNDYLLYKTR